MGLEARKRSSATKCYLNSHLSDSDRCELQVRISSSPWSPPKGKWSTNSSPSESVGLESRSIFPTCSLRWPKIKFREDTFPSLRQTGESSSLNLVTSPDSGVGPLRATCVNRGERAASERPIQPSLELDANFAPPPTKTSCRSIAVIHPSPNLS